MTAPATTATTPIPLAPPVGDDPTAPADTTTPIPVVPPAREQTS